MRRPYLFLVFTLAAAACLRLFLLRTLPPGLHYDLATNLLLGSDIAFHGYRPIFIEAYTGREVLFFYLLALLMRFIGSHVFTLHLAGAFTGLLTVAASYFAVRHVFGHDPYGRTWLAALSAALLAGSLWHVLLSRLGYRLLTEPLVQALALGFLFWGLRLWPLDSPASGASQRPAPRRAWLYLALGGAFIGLAAYTYLAARAFPIPLAAAFLVLLVARPRRALLPLAIVVVAALIIFAPLGYFFLTHPASFLNRMGQVAPGPADQRLLFESTVAAFKMLFIRGDPYLRFNNPGQPIFGPVLGFFFVVGLAITVLRAMRARRAVDRAAEVMLLVWIPAMLLPTILAVHEIFPSNVRAIGLIPLVFVPAARGLIESAAWLAHRIAPRLTVGTVANASGIENLSVPDNITPQGVKGAGVSSARPFASLRVTFLRGFSSLVSSICLVSLLISTSVIYFSRWGRSAEVYRANDADLVAAAEWLNSQSLDGASVYMSAIHYRHPTLAVLAHDYDAIKWFTGAQSLAIPQSGPAVYVFPHSAQPPAEWLADWGVGLVASPTGPDGQPDYLAYRFEDMSAIIPEGADFIPVTANFGNVIELIGYRPVRLVSGAELAVDLYWRVLNPPDTGDFRIVADLMDAWDFRWAQAFNDTYPSEQWQAGETVITRLRWEPIIGLPPGDYRPAVTLFAPSTGQRLSVVNADGAFAGVEAQIGSLAVEPVAGPGTGTVAPAIISGDSLGPLVLLGYDPPPATLKPGERLRFALYWQATDAPATDYTLTTTLTASDDSTVDLESVGPVHGAYPTSQWAVGEVIIDRHDPRLPRDLPAGAYEVIVTVSGGPGASGAVSLGTIEVESLARDFNPPQPEHPTALNFSDTIEFAGYTIETSTLTPTLTLTLYWRSLAETEIDYTVFVHLLDAQGQVAAQRDVQPRNGAYPTSLWVAGETVADMYQFDVAPGTYRLEVGLYRPESGERLGSGMVASILEVP